MEKSGHPGWLVIGIFLAVIGGLEWSRLSANYHTACVGLSGALQPTACNNELLRTDLFGLTALAGIMVIILAIATWGKVRA
jgi:hypothetical protein